MRAGLNGIVLAHEILDLVCFVFQGLQPQLRNLVLSHASIVVTFELLVQLLISCWNLGG